MTSLFVSDMLPQALVALASMQGMTHSKDTATTQFAVRDVVQGHSVNLVAECHRRSSTICGILTSTPGGRKGRVFRLRHARSVWSRVT